MIPRASTEDPQDDGNLPGGVACQASTSYSANTLTDRPRLGHMTRDGSRIPDYRPRRQPERTTLQLGAVGGRTPIASPMTTGSSSSRGITLSNNWQNLTDLIQNGQLSARIRNNGHGLETGDPLPTPGSKGSRAALPWPWTSGTERDEDGDEVEARVLVASPPPMNAQLEDEVEARESHAERPHARSFVIPPSASWRKSIMSSHTAISKSESWKRICE